MFYITDSNEKITKPRTKQTARMSTGGTQYYYILLRQGIIAMLFKY